MSLVFWGDQGGDIWSGQDLAWVAEPVFVWLGSFVTRSLTKVSLVVVGAGCC